MFVNYLFAYNFSFVRIAKSLYNPKIKIDQIKESNAIKLILFTSFYSFAKTLINIKTSELWVRFSKTFDFVSFRTFNVNFLLLHVFYNNSSFILTVRGV